MAHGSKRLMLVSAPGLVQKATEAVLSSCSGVALVAQARGALSATSLLSTLQLDLVLIDATVAEEEMEALLSWVKVHHPRVQCVALTMTSRQRDLALAWGADIAIHRADLTSHLKAMLDCVPSSSIHEVNLDSADWSAN